MRYKKAREEKKKITTLEQGEWATTIYFFFKSGAYKSKT